MDKWINEKNSAFLVFMFTIIGYGMAFFFEQGYLGYYEIDWNFIRISPLQIVIGAAFALVFVTIFDFLTTTISSISKEYDRDNPLHRAKLDFWITTLTFIGLILLIYLLSINKSEFGVIFIGSLGFYILFLTIIFGDALRRDIKLKNWEEALRLSYKDYDEKNAKKRLEDQTKQGRYSKNFSSITLSFNIVKDFFKPGAVILLMFWAASIFGHQFNSGYVNKFVTVVKAESSVKQIVIRQYGDNVLVIKYDMDKAKRIGGFEIIDSKGHEYVLAVVECTNDFKNKEDPSVHEKKVQDSCPKK